jgi:DNA-binding MarR family transcriptional regulator
MNARFSLSNFLPYRLAVVSERVSRRLSVDYGRSHNLSVAEWRVLVHLHRHGTVSVREIQDYANLEKSRVSRAVQRLVTAGLVRKTQSKVDARLVEIALTQNGMDALSEILPVASDVESRLLENIPENDLAAFYRVIDHIHDVLDSDPEARPRPTRSDS